MTPFAVLAWLFAAYAVASWALMLLMAARNRDLGNRLWIAKLALRQELERRGHKDELARRAAGAEAALTKLHVGLALASPSLGHPLPGSPELNDPLPEGRGDGNGIRLIKESGS